jgi:DNA repair protein NreA
VWFPYLAIGMEDLAAVLARIDPRLCVQCKAARGLCGIDPCPLLRKVTGYLPKAAVAGRDLIGSSPPTMFVGRHGYPKVSIGPMLPPDHRDEEAARLLDNPAGWLGLTIPDVVGLRSSLLRTTHLVRVDQAARNPDRITRLSQELAIAARPVDTEVRLKRVPQFGVPTVGEFTAPHGPTVGVERAQLAQNVRVENAVERATSDTDLRASEALGSLYHGGIDLYQVERILSAGMVGLQKRRRLVPTRWAITATDDQIGLDLIDRVRDLPTIDKPTVHFAERFGNRFFILLLPRVWGFDSVEAWLKGNFWSRDAAEIVEADWEDFDGRSKYAATAGGYYATRLAVLEHLLTLGRQATAIVHREITDAYTTPLGVWVVRETSRLALQQKGLMFEDLDAALRHIDRHALLKSWQHHAALLKRVRLQSSLDSF